MESCDTQHVDVVGVGFGPAAISLACAIADEIEATGESPAGSVVFLEKMEQAGWHPQFLLNGTDINHHVFRDLVTPRNPRSRFTFPIYLKEKGRLYKFGLLGRPASRAEWSDYVSWVAAQLDTYASYGEAVTELLPVLEGGRLTAIDVVTPKARRRTSTVVLSTGSDPRIPTVFDEHLGDRVFHTSRYLQHVDLLSKAPPRRWLVVGSGQSAGEAVIDILNRFPRCSVRSVHRGSGFRIGQLGQFPNLAFLPERVDYFHKLGPEARSQLLSEVKSTNYAGIDVDESHHLYSVIYEESVTGQQRLTMMHFSMVEEVTVQDDGSYRVILQDVFTGEHSAMEVDAIVLGTGFQQPIVPPILAPLQPWLVAGSDGGIVIDRDYRVRLESDTFVRLFVNGLSERTHGIGEGQSFSLMAMRSERLLKAIAANRHACSSRLS